MHARACLGGRNGESNRSKRMVRESLLLRSPAMSLGFTIWAEIFFFFFLGGGGEGLFQRFCLFVCF